MGILVLLQLLTYMHPFLGWSDGRIFFGLNWTHRPVIGLKLDTAEEMVEVGCLATKTLKFYKDSEYQVNMSTSKTSKQKTEKESSKAFRYLQTHFFDHKTEAILALVLKRH